MSPKPTALNEAQFAESVINGQGLALVDFWATWCGPCLMLAPTLEQIANEFDGRLQVFKVNIEENPSIANQYRIMNIPLVMLFKDGQMVDQLVGNQPKKKFVEMIQSHL